ncbi:MAG TPA: hemerythrin domain-containing protein [Pirellulales bacterium]|jgi:hypothetical protein|nr:hemerythrin domain-containing protein [Pirellulales bacterium]
MVTAQRTLTINAAFLQEIKEDNRELRQLLEETGGLLARPHEAGIELRRVARLLGKLRDQLAMHFSLEEAYGYFDDGIDVAPRLSRRAEALRSQHPRLFVALCDLVEEAEQLVYHERPLGAGDLASGFARFHRQFQQHEAEEISLVVQMFNEEIGGGD